MRHLALVIVVLSAGTGWLTCSGRLGGPPDNPNLGAGTETTVMLNWEAPEEGTPDYYHVYFREVRREVYVRIAELSATHYEHDPDGMTGWYRVAALYGADLYYAAETLSTVPVGTSELRLYELDARPDSAGLGWERQTGKGEIHPMTESRSAGRVDFYVTDFAAGYGGPVLSLASPTYGPGEPSGEVPDGPWRLTRFTADLPYEHAPLPAYNERAYRPYQSVTPGSVIGCRSEDGHYGLVKVTAVDTLSGVLELSTWIQLVPGLRLIAHR